VCQCHHITCCSRHLRRGVYHITRTQHHYHAHAMWRTNGSTHYASEVSFPCHIIMTIASKLPAVMVE
jgi:hypothetical protein